MKFFIYCFFLILVLTGCEKIIEIEANPNTEKFIVLSGGLELREEQSDINCKKANLKKIWQQIQLSISSDVNEPLALTNYVNDAQVLVSDSQSNLYTLTIQNERGEYGANIPLKMNETYVLKIIHQSDVYIAQASIENKVPIGNINISKVQDDPFPLFTFFFSDDQDEKNFLWWKYYFNGNYKPASTNSSRFAHIYSDVNTNGRPEISVDYNFAFEFSDTPNITSGYCIYIEQHSIQESYFSFLELVMQDLNNNPIAGGDVPPSKILGNIYNVSNPEKRMLGFFYASYVSTDYRVIP